MYAPTQNGLGQFDVTPLLSWLQPAVLSWWDKQKIQSLLPEFPGVFEQAVADWAKLKVGVKGDLFTPAQIEESLVWFRQLPRLWESLKPNFTEDQEFAGRVDSFIGQLSGSSLLETGGLGFVVTGTIALVAGVMLVGGAAAGLWAVGYIQEQANISDMIDGVVAGQIPAAVLDQAVKAESDGGFFGGLGSAAKWLFLGGVAFLIIPRVWKR